MYNVTRRCTGYWLPSIFTSIRPTSTKFYKKSELMFMRRARAYSSFCSLVILVYLHLFRRNSLFCIQK